MFLLLHLPQRVNKNCRDINVSSIRLSEKFLSFYEEIIDAQCILFYIILPNYVQSILFCWDKHRDISQTWFHVCTKHKVIKFKGYQVCKYETGICL